MNKKQHHECKTAAAAAEEFKIRCYAKNENYLIHLTQAEKMTNALLFQPLKFIYRLWVSTASNFINFEPRKVAWT